jgi:hypothetical protein
MLDAEHFGDAGFHLERFFRVNGGGWRRLWQSLAHAERRRRLTGRAREHNRRLDPA